MSCVVLHLLANMQAELMQKADSLVFRLLQLACFFQHPACFFNSQPVFSTSSLFFQHPCHIAHPIALSNAPCHFATYSYICVKMYQRM